MTPRSKDDEQGLTTINEAVLIKTRQELNKSEHAEATYSVDMARDSYIWCYEGWRGGGKTTAMTVMAVLANWLYGSRIISNYPIEYMIQLRSGKKRHVKAEPLDFQKLLTFDDSLNNALILIDESPDVVSNMAAMSIKNRLVNIFIRQIRKNNNSLFLGAQQYELIDKSLRWQVDIIARCQDAGRKFGNTSMRRGTCILLDLYDNSGMWTGHHWSEYGSYRGWDNAAGHLELMPSIFWGNNGSKPVYDTFYQQDIMESLRKATLKLEAYEVSDKGKITDTEYLGRALAVIDEVLATDEKTIYSKNFYDVVGALTGSEKDALAKRLVRCNVRQAMAGNNKRFYDFSVFDREAFSEF